MFRGTSQPGYRVYSSLVLTAYDAYVLGFNCRYVWRCPASQMQALYDEGVSGNHLDIGVGTGYFLDRCRFPVAQPKVTIFDANQNSLRKASSRLARYAPQTRWGDVLEPFPSALGTFDSVGMNFLLHCLPSPFRDKERALANARAVLNTGGRCFGSTVLGTGVEINRLARTTLARFNETGIFSNRNDSRQDLEAALARHFSSARVWVRGAVALWIAVA